MVPGIGASPDRMLLARMFPYADAHRARLGVNYEQIPVNAPVMPVHTYSMDGVMRVVNRTGPVYFPNSKGGPRADPGKYRQASWYTDGELVRTAYVKHAQDDDWGQAGTLVRDVLDDAARDRLVGNIVGILLNGVTEPVLERAFWYLGNVDKSLGERVEKGVRDGRRRS
jgi:catalase